MDIRRINSQISVTGQIRPMDIATIKRLGFMGIINNRPDGEAPDQPLSAQIRLAANAMGIDYHHIPLGHDGVSRELIVQTRETLLESTGPILAFCRLGPRSVTLWALSQADMASNETIFAQAAQAGYDITHLSQLLADERLQARPAAQAVTSAGFRCPVNASARPWAISGPNLKPWPEQALRTQAALPIGSTTKRSSSATV